jgi:hypothetical protein
MTISTTPRPETSSGLDAAELRQRLVDLAAASGVKRWDLGAGCSTDTSVQVDRGEAKQMKGAQRSAITVRVWNDQGLVGVTSTSDLTDSGLERALAGARDASAFGNPEDTPGFSPLATAPLAELEQPLHQPVGILELLDTLKEAERDLLGRHPAASISMPAPRRPAASRAVPAPCVWPTAPAASTSPAASRRPPPAPSPILTTPRSTPAATPASSRPRPSSI